MDIINKSGAWYSYGEVRLGQGRENARQFLKENEDLRDEIEFKVLKEFGLEGTKTKISPEDEEK